MLTSLDPTGHHSHRGIIREISRAREISRVSCVVTYPLSTMTGLLWVGF
jgi:hypothetical protein